jgi:hypothetical protein
MSSLCQADAKHLDPSGDRGKAEALGRDAAAALLAGNALAAMPARTAARTAPAISLCQE